MSNKAVELVRKLFRDAEEANILKSVWSLVSALRGPDEECMYRYKWDTTAKIRACLLTANQALCLGCDRNPFRDVDDVRDVRDYENSVTFNADTMPPSHFRTHIMFAQVVINNDWELPDAN